MTIHEAGLPPVLNSLTTLHSDTGVQAVTVAAIIPLYNGAAFIEEAIDSILRQTEQPEEIVVVNDGSTDEGPRIVESLAKKHPIKLISQTNMGQSAARNAGIRETQCSHIALLDQDDLWLPGHLAALKGPFREDQEGSLGFVYGNLDRIDKQGRLLVRNYLDQVPATHPKNSVFQCMSEDMYVLPGASLFLKRAWEKVDGFDERLAGYEDDDFFLRLFAAGFKNHYLHSTTVSQWRVYDSSCSYSPRMAKSRMIYFRKLRDAYPDEPRLNLFFARDGFGPRLLKSLYFDLMRCSRDGDLAAIAQNWEDIKELAPVLKKGLRRRIGTVQGLVDILHRTRFQGATRNLVRYALRSSVS